MFLASVESYTKVSSIQLDLVAFWLTNDCDFIYQQDLRISFQSPLIRGGECLYEV